MITSINRAWAFDPGIVTITSTDTILDCLAVGYLTAQADVISILNNGAFEFRFGDLVALSASDTSELLKFNGTDFSTLIPSEGSPGSQILQTNVIVSPGTSTLAIPDGTVYLYFELCAGGGGGGGAIDGGGANTFAAGGGGGGGGSTKGYLFNGNYSFITGNISYTVGAGGAGGVGAANGAAGGGSSFTIASLGQTRTVSGGTGGGGSTGLSSTATAFVPGGVGGGAAGSPAQAGGYGFMGSINAGAVCSGAGASGPYGSGGGSRIADNNGIIANGVGAGGGGASRLTAGTSTGGNGNVGMLYVTFFGLVV